MNRSERKTYASVPFQADDDSDGALSDLEIDEDFVVITEDDAVSPPDGQVPSEAPSSSSSSISAWDRIKAGLGSCFSACGERCAEQAERCAPHFRGINGTYLLLFASLLLLTLSPDGTWAMVGLALFLSAGVSVFLRTLLARRLRVQQQPRTQAERMQQLQMQLHQLGFPSSRTHLRLAMMDRDFDANDYDALTRLDEEHRSQILTGIPQSQIERLPTMSVREESELVETRCPICLEQYAVDDRLRVVPCLHKFHTHCIDRALREKAKCPVCNFPVDLN